MTDSPIYQAIVTKFLGPTNFRGSRIKVKAYAGSKTYSWDYALNVEQNHSRAAQSFAKHMGWLGDGWDLRGGSMPDGTGNCYVLVKINT